MPTQALHPFSKSPETFIAVDWGKIIYSSQAHGLGPLLEFMAKYPKSGDLVIFDNAVGRAAASLLTLVKPKVIYGLVGTQSAVAILAKAGLTCHFTEIVEQLNTTTESDDYEMLAQGREPAELLAVLRGSKSVKSVKKTVAKKVATKVVKKSKVAKKSAK
jgi:hypothetical protein